MKQSINKRNWKTFSRSNLLPNADGTKPNTQQEDTIFRQNTELLDRFHAMFNSLQDLRLDRARNVRYTFGDQLGDLIQDPDAPCQHMGITERQYMMQQGIVPLEMNVIRKMTKALVGVYRQDRIEPNAIARDRNEQKLGEMMSIALQYAYQSNNLQETNARGYEEFLISAVPCFRVGFDWNAERKISDVFVELCDINRMAWDDNTTGQYFENISTIGYLHDMTIGQVLSRFAHSKRDKDAIAQIYKQCKTYYPSNQQQFQRNDTRKTSIQFYTPISEDKCRVIEIWSKEEHEVYVCHDIATGEYYTVDINQEDYILAENERRVLQMTAVGGNSEDAALIEYEYKVDEEWIVRYLSPNGYILHQEVSPYTHGSHPFAIGAYPLIDGEVHSLVGDTINAQRMINRLTMRIEFSRMNDAKGFLAVRKKVLENSGLTLQEFVNQYTSPKGVVAMDWDDEPFKQITSNSAASSGDVQMLQTYFQLMDEITGVHGALRGEKTGSNTPASLYAQQTQNANNNIADGQEWYNGLIRLRDQKMMMVIQQFYQGKRFINIAGKDYSEESKWYDSDKIRNCMFDLALIQSASNGVTRAQNESLLLELLKSGAIDPQTYLESTSAPFSDKLLERMKARQEEQAKQAEQQQIAQAQQAVQAQSSPAQQPTPIQNR